MSTNKNDEKVLVFDKEATKMLRAVLDDYKSKDKNDPTFEQRTQEIESIIMAMVDTPGCTKLERRGDVENDTSYLQIIPYVAIVNSEKKVLVYERTNTSSETRLQNKASIGFGGHLNSSDTIGSLNHKLATGRPDNILVIGAMRELNEEIKLDDPEAYLMLTTRFIFDNTNDVSNVHLGLVLVAITDVVPELNENKLCNLRFETIEDAKKIDTMESWSSILLDMIDTEATRCIERSNAKKEHSEATVEAKDNS